MPDPLSKVVDDLVARMREPLGIDRWQIKIVFGPGEEMAACAAMPEYLQATFAVDPDRLQTGDELDEVLAHEVAHCPIWVLASLADDLAIAVAESAPEPSRESLLKLLREQVRKAEESTTTQVGQTFIRLLRRIWAAEETITGLRSEIRQLKRTLPTAG